MVGIDAVAIHRIDDALDRWGETFEQTVLSSRERDGCASAPALARSVAAHVAVKESVVKALGGRGRDFRWPDIEVLDARDAAISPASAEAVGALADAVPAGRFIGHGTWTVRGECARRLPAERADRSWWAAVATDTHVVAMAGV